MRTRNTGVEFNKYRFIYLASQVALVIENQTANAGDVQETQVRSLGREDPLEKEMATHSSTLAWTIPWMKEPSRLYSMGSKKSAMTEQLHWFTKK